MSGGGHADRPESIRAVGKKKTPGAGGDATADVVCPPRRRDRLEGACYS